MEIPAPNKGWIMKEGEKYGITIQPHLRHGTITPPQWDNRESCCAWHHRGYCFETCPRAYAHSSKSSDIPQKAAREHDRFINECRRKNSSAKN